MAREHNYLLGQGERLTAPVKVPSGGGSKRPPYDFGTARLRAAGKLARTTAAFTQLPADACPNNEVVAVVTMHPRYVSKTDFPSQLLGAVGVRSVGSRSRSMTPDEWGIKDPPVSAVTEEYFVVGTRTTFDDWSTGLGAWTAKSPGAADLSHVEDISPLTTAEKLRSIPEDRQEALFEVVVHDANPQVLAAFEAYAKKHGAVVLMDRRRDVRGLSFIPVRAPIRSVPQIAGFSFVRVLRGMPTLRPFRPGLLRSSAGFGVELPDEAVVDPTVRALVFDGGLPTSVDLSRWVTTIEPAGLSAPVPDYEAHGLAVTSALLFGPLLENVTAARPLCAVDHVRVLDDRTVDDAEMMYVDALDRILDVLDHNGEDYMFVNISLGPRLAVTDDEVTAWTASLDERFARLNLVATVAAGNDGELDAESGLNRVQPPADGVNVLAIGASDRTTDDWVRAEYSCVGPGRSPGIVKPDGVVFGGSPAEPFMVLKPGSGLRAVGEEGTSFASPFALRSAVGLRVQLGGALGPLATRAVMIHRADRSSESQAGVGWGRFEVNHRTLITTEDDEAIVIYQGTLPVGEHLRALVPMPQEKLTGRITIGATLVISPEVDPNHPSAYTRSGLSVSFRPHAKKFGGTKQTPSAHPKTTSFFSASNMYSAAEYMLRDDGHKWEPCLRNEQNFLPKSLDQPCFDIYYNHRHSGTSAADPQPIPYALVVSVRAPKVPDLYSRVVRAYAKVLVPLKPQVRIPIRTMT
jgi:Subtilase family